MANQSTPDEEIERGPPGDESSGYRRHGVIVAGENVLPVGGNVGGRTNTSWN
jgi:hypothetical protein